MRGIGFCICGRYRCALGVLFAPASGDEARDYLLASANDGLDRAFVAGQKLRQRAQRSVEDAKGRVRQATKVGEDAFREAKNSSF
jgi:gas vesicle protein